MAGAVGDEGDQVGMGCAFGVAVVQQGADHFDQLKIADLVLAPDVIAAAQCAFEQHGQQRIGVVFDKQPVSNIFPISINRNGKVLSAIIYEQG